MHGLHGAVHHPACGVQFADDVTRHESWNAAGLRGEPSQEFLRLLRCRRVEKVWVERIYLTVIHRRYEGDIFFPEIPAEFVETSREEVVEDIPYALVRYERKA